MPLRLTTPLPPWLLFGVIFGGGRGQERLAGRGGAAGGRGGGGRAASEQQPVAVWKSKPTPCAALSELGRGLSTGRGPLPSINSPSTSSLGFGLSCQQHQQSLRLGSGELHRRLASPGGDGGGGQSRDNLHPHVLHLLRLLSPCQRFDGHGVISGGGDGRDGSDALYSRSERPRRLLVGREGRRSMWCGDGGKFIEVEQRRCASVRGWATARGRFFIALLPRMPARAADRRALGRRESHHRVIGVGSVRLRRRTSESATFAFGGRSVGKASGIRVTLRAVTPSLPRFTPPRPPRARTFCHPQGAPTAHRRARDGSTPQCRTRRTSPSPCAPITSLLSPP